MTQQLYLLMVNISCRCWLLMWSEMETFQITNDYLLACVHIHSLRWYIIGTTRSTANCSILRWLLLPTITDWCCYVCHPTRLSLHKKSCAVSHHQIRNYHWVSIDSAKSVRMTKSGVTLGQEECGKTLPSAAMDHSFHYDRDATGSCMVWGKTALLSLYVLENDHNSYWLLL